MPSNAFVIGFNEAGLVYIRGWAILVRIPNFVIIIKSKNKGIQQR